MYRRDFARIPDERAIRVTYEEERLLNASGDSCLGQSLSKTYTFREEIDDNLTDTKTTVKYERTGENKTFHNEDTFVLNDIHPGGGGGEGGGGPAIYGLYRYVPL